MQHFLSIEDVTDLNKLVHTALDLKKDPYAYQGLGRNKTMALIFLNPSLRTRLSTQKAARALGMEAMVMNMDKDGWQLETEEGVLMNGKTAEHVKEAAAVIGQYCDVIGIRSFPSLKDRETDYEENFIRSFKKYAGVPIVSLESATLHPLQSLADLVTIEEYRHKTRPKVVLTWAPHIKALPQAVPNSFAQWMNHADVDFVITHPEGYELSPEFAGNAPVDYNQRRAFEGADFIYAKNWSSYQDYGRILRNDSDWIVDGEKMALTNEAKFMHCLPIRRNVIATDEVLDSPQSIVIPQAGNRFFAATAVLKSILEG